MRTTAAEPKPASVTDPEPTDRRRTLCREPVVDGVVNIESIGAHAGSAPALRNLPPTNPPRHLHFVRLDLPTTESAVGLSHLCGQVSDLTDVGDTFHRHDQLEAKPLSQVSYV